MALQINSVNDAMTLIQNNSQIFHSCMPFKPNVVQSKPSNGVVMNYQSIPINKLLTTSLTFFESLNEVKNVNGKNF